MNLFIPTIFALLVSTAAIGQSSDIVETELSSTNNYSLSVIQVFPDSFPLVSVIFQAKNELGEPLWLLDKNDFGIRENGFECEIVEVQNISKNIPLNIALVFDHSGSMVDNPSQMNDSLDTYQDLYFQNMLPDDYIMSIDYAKEGILEFFATEKVERDSMFFVGFSETVDKIEPITNDYKNFESFVKKVVPGGRTAFFDALYTSIDSLSLHKSKPIIIGLTDGADNSSTHTYQEVIEYAIKRDVKIYIIGLGDVNSELLKTLSTETKGMYYYTTDPSKLNTIYTNIKKQLKSIYELDYLSNEDNTNVADRNIEFYFKNDTLTFSDSEFYFDLPEEVVSLLEIRHKKNKELEKLRLEEIEYQEKLKLYGITGGAILLLGISTFVIVSRRRKLQKLEIKNVYPNPISGPTTISYLAGEIHTNLLIRISNVNGKLLFKKKISQTSNEVTIDLSKLNRGIYLVRLKSSSHSSNTFKIVKK